MPQRITPEQYRQSRANGWTDDDLVQMGYELPSPQRGLPSAAPVDQTGPRAGGGGLQPVADIARMGAQGATYNWLDEGIAGIRALSPNVTYKEAAADEQRKVDEARSRMGGLATVAELAGGVAVPGIGVSKLAAKVPVATRGAQLAKQIGTAAASGAVGGAVGGAGNARAGEKVNAAKNNALLGALFGAGVATAGAAGRQAARYLGAKNAVGATEKTADALLESMERQGLPNGTEDDVARYAISLPRPSASGMRVMDVNGPMQELGVDAARSNKVIERQFDDIAAARKATQNTDIADDFADAMGTKRGVEAPRVSDAITKGIKQYEDQAYAQLFARNPNPVRTPAAQEVVEDIRTYLAQLPHAEEASRVLSGGNIDDILQGGDYTLEGLHRLKTAVGGRAAALNARKMEGQLTDEEQGRLIAYTGLSERLRNVIQKAPGGKDWSKIQRAGERARRATDALSEGQDVMSGPLTGYKAEQALNEASSPLASGQAFPKGAQRLREGAASRVRDEARQATQGSDAFINRFAEQDATQDAVNALAPAPDKAARFKQNMQDRRAMAETNRLQGSRSTQQKEILKGARARSTALALGEAGGLGSLLMGGGGDGLKGSLRLAAGAMAAKALEGGRRKATEKAASDLARLLQRNANDPAVTGMFYDMAMALQRLQRGRISGQAGVAALAPYLLRSNSNTDR